MKLLGMVLCLIYAHKRGKRKTVDLITARRTGKPPLWTYECPRCSATWTRKGYVPKAQSSPTDGSAHFQETQA